MCRNDSITTHICSSDPPGRAVLAAGAAAGWRCVWGVEGLPTACRAEAAFQDMARASEFGTYPLLSLVGERAWRSRGCWRSSPFTSIQTPKRDRCHGPRQMSWDRCQVTHQPCLYWYQPRSSLAWLPPLTTSAPSRVLRMGLLPASWTIL